MMATPEVFEPDAGRLRRLLFAAACCWAVVAVPLLPYLIAGWIRPHAFLFMVTFALIGAYMQHRRHRARDGAIAADEEGLWLVSSSREAGLVPWDAIVFTQWSTFPGALYLRGEQGKNLLTVPLDLHGFGRLEEILAEKTGNRGSGPVHTPPTAYMVRFPAFLWPILAGLGLLASLVPTEGAVAIVVLPFSAFWWMLLFLPQIEYQFRLDSGRIRISRPFEPKEIAREEIESVTIWDPFQGHLPGRAVVLNLKWDKLPVQLPAVHYSPEDIKARIEAWLAEPSTDAAKEPSAPDTAASRVSS